MKSISKNWQRTPISYYGGKQTMLPYILPLIPKHEIYTEPFFGGGAVFWAKEQVKTEIINDFNTNVYNFYNVLKNNFRALKKIVENTIISRDAYKSALIIYNTPHLFSELQRAWAFWFATNFGFSNQVMNCRITSNSKNVKLLNNKIEKFTDEYSKRLQNVQLENNDACEVIQKRDDIMAFHYCDPPYVGANQGHYGGYTQEHFNELLNTLSRIKGKFILSSYQNEELIRYVNKFDWKQHKILLHLGSSNTRNKKRQEILTINF